MRKAFTTAPVSATPHADAARNSSGAARIERLTTLRAEIEAGVERIRLVMIEGGPYGFQTGVAELLDIRKERVSKQLQRVENLTVELFLAEVALHRFEGRDETADRLLAALTAGQPIQMRTKGAVVIRLSDGQIALNFE